MAERSAVSANGEIPDNDRSLMMSKCLGNAAVEKEANNNMLKRRGSPGTLQYWVKTVGCITFRMNPKVKLIDDFDITSLRNKNTRICQNYFWIKNLSNMFKNANR